jgi:hypothetical protein
MLSRPYCKQRNICGRKFIRSYRAFCSAKVQANHSDIGMARIIHLHDGVGERDATGRRLPYDPALQLLVLGEAVDRHWFGPRFQERDAVFDLLDLKKKRERKTGAPAIQRHHFDRARRNEAAAVCAHHDDREKRAEYLLRHDVRIKRRVKQNGGFDAPAVKKKI